MIVPSRLIAIDPSLRASGWAYFEDGELVTGGVATTRKSMSVYCLFTALSSVLSREVSGRIDVLVAEWPQVYVGARSKGDPNDLLWLTAVLGSAVAEVAPQEVILYKPAEWKGQVDKRVHNIRVMARLESKELAIVKNVAVTESLRHNMIDAIGIGLKYLKRLEPRRNGTSTVDPSFKIKRYPKGPGRA